MSAIQIHQIFYSDETRRQLDPGFIPLDNLTNERPDWREYWPIRRYLLDHPPEGDGFIGFFSPKFREKTALSADDVKTFVSELPRETDVVLFSPFFDQIAAYWNVFEHGMNHHPGMFETFKLTSEALVPGVILETLVTDSRNTVFSNFFVARTPFWKEWLAKNEMLFSIAEDGASGLAKRLNEKVNYRDERVHAKVFVMERVATLMLATNRMWRTRVHNPLLRPIDGLFEPFRLELICMDALKIASTTRDAGEYRAAFRFIREQISERTKALHKDRTKR